jgi:hypothetical protein
MQGNFTVITVSQKTKEDMSGWSMEVEAEREELLESVSYHLKVCLKCVNLFRHSNIGAICRSEINCSKRHTCQ